ncbi:hypothetical protein [Verrucomicrobium spinosum]|uniref:golvesin C-terminal-like domain-containing protein n=1 Tax=Verrucomicrobium spinosum TaxID=2736 RepID=UPI000AC5ED16
MSQQDYYALAGIFRSTQVVMGTRNGCVNVASWVERPLPVPEPQRGELEQQVSRLELIMRLKVEKDFKQKSGGKKTLDDLPLAGVVYDEADAELTGAWKSSTLSPKRFGETYIHDDRQEKGGRQALFRGSLPESGVYEVRVAYSRVETAASRCRSRWKRAMGFMKSSLTRRRSPPWPDCSSPWDGLSSRKGPVPT